MAQISMEIMRPPGSVLGGNQHPTPAVTRSTDPAIISRLNGGAERRLFHCADAPLAIRPEKGPGGAGSSGNGFAVLLFVPALRHPAALRAPGPRLGCRSGLEPLTEAGQQLFPPLREGLDLMAGAVEWIAAHRAHPSVVITTTTAFAAHWLIPRLATFRQRHPEIALSVLASDDIINLEAGKAALAIRLSNSRHAEREAKPLFSDRFTLVASPTLKVTIPADLERTPLIEFDWHRPREDMPSWPKWLTAAGLDRLALSPQLRFNEESHAFQAAIAGQGVALFSLTIAGDALRRCILVQPFDTTIPGQTYYLVRGRSPVGSPVDAVSAWILGETVAEANAPSSAIIAGDRRNVSGSVAG